MYKRSGDILTHVVLCMAVLAFLKDATAEPTRSIVDPDSVFYESDLLFVQAETPPASTGPSTSQPVPQPQLNPFSAAATTPLRADARRRRVGRTPAMFGDYLGQSVSVFIGGEEGGSDIEFRIPCTPGRFVKIGENNSAAISDRCYVTYNHFHNAFNPPNSSDINQYTFGIERRIFASRWSIETRMPFVGDLDFSDRDARTFMQTSHVGNLSLILKNELYRDQDTIFSGGLGVSVPTGGNTQLELDFYRSGHYQFDNDAVHISPYFAIQQSYDGGLFWNAFAQLDVDVNGNTINFLHEDYPRKARVQDQTLLLLDLSVGKYFYQNPEARVLRGVAGLLELHYTTALENIDPNYIEDLDLTNSNRFDVTNMSTVAHFVLGDRTVLRTGFVFPLTEDRAFDSEVMVQLQFNGY